VLPFVFTRLRQPFRTSILPMLVGMAVSFAMVGSLAAVSGGWVVRANQTGRLAALVLLAFFGLELLTAIADRPTSRPGPTCGPWVGASLLLGVAIGLLWAPCAGPILGLILTGAASVNSALLLFAYGLGAAVSLALVEQAVDLKLQQENPAVKAWKFISTRVTQYHRISWVEPPEMLELIDRFERQRVAERSSLMGLRLRMITLGDPVNSGKPVGAASDRVPGALALSPGMLLYGVLWREIVKLCLGWMAQEVKRK
jgi:cytochrome c biogenesis protein CcdA